MTSATLRWLGLDREKWSNPSQSALPASIAFALTASVLMAWNRFGGQLFDQPRSFARMTLVGVHGWLGLAVALWLISAAPHPFGNPAGPGERPSLRLSVIAVGLAHMPVLILGAIIFVSAGILQILGPGLVAAYVVFGLWFPSVLLVATKFTYQLGWTRAGAVIALPYLAWLQVVGRHLLDQVQHLL